MRYIAILIIGLFAFGSCENLLIKDLEIDDTQFEKQLVVQSFLEVGSDSVVAFISENESILTPSTEIKYMGGADVRLRYEGTEIAKLEQGEDLLYYHYFESPLSDRGEYEIIVSETPYETASAVTELPLDRNIRDLEFSFNLGTDPLEMSNVSEISFIIDDASGKDYYTINIRTVSSGLDTFIWNQDTIIEERYIYIYPAATQLDPSISTTGYAGEIIIDDTAFDGQSKEVKVRFVTSYFTTSPGFEDELRDILRLDFTTHSEESFNYTTSFNAYQDSQDFGLFSEPVSVYTNIENGLGIFAGSSTKVYDFK